MGLPIWANNLISYILQIAILVSAGTLLAYLIRLRVPQVALYYWQLLLLFCLLLPFMQSWKRSEPHIDAIYGEPIVRNTDISQAIPLSSVTRSIPQHTFRVPTATIIIWVFAGGVFFRLMWLMLGFFRLRHFRKHSKICSDMPSVIQEMQKLIGVKAQILFSDGIDSPISFGVLKPVIVLPLSFAGMSELHQRAIICHELLHVRRHDWAMTAAEEIVRSAYWFHPAIWWLLSRIHLTREQAVDHEAVQLTGTKVPYLESLLEIARSRGRPRAVPASLFLKERHFIQRVALLLKEPVMSRAKLIFTLIGTSILLYGAIVLTPGWFPLMGDPSLLAQDLEKASSQSVVTENEAKPSFEVISIKRMTQFSPSRSSLYSPGGRYSASGVWMVFTISEAYHLMPFQLVGYPDWAGSDLWQIEAKAGEGTFPLDEKGMLDDHIMELMIQSMLADRFKLRVHWETRTLPIYELVIAKGGPKIKPSPKIEPAEGKNLEFQSFERVSKGLFEGKRVTVSRLAFVLALTVTRCQVIDKTGLEGLYDIKLEYTPDSTSVGTQTVADSGVSIFEAIQDQLGLKLVSKTGPAQVMVVDNLEKPSEN